MTTAATGSQVLEPDPLTQASLAEPVLCPLVGARDRIQQSCHRGGIGICLVERSRQEGPSDGPWVDVGASGEAGQLGSVLRVEQNVHTVRVVRHFHPNTQNATLCAV